MRLKPPRPHVNPATACYIFRGALRPDCTLVIGRNFPPQESKFRRKAAADLDHFMLHRRPLCLSPSRKEPLAFAAVPPATCPISAGSFSTGMLRLSSEFPLALYRQVQLPPLAAASARNSPDCQVAILHRAPFNPLSRALLPG